MKVVYTSFSSSSRFKVSSSLAESDSKGKESMLHLAFDDTDSLRGMCTTFLATEMVREFSDLDLIGYPRLVRLNPNVPWKTRGNGALCVRFGRGTGHRYKVGEIDGHNVFAWRRCGGSPPPENILRRASRVLEDWAEFQEDLTNPAIAVLYRKPPQSMYWKAERGLVPVKEARRIADSCGVWKGYKNGRGIVGSVAAAAWRPRDRTYEVLTYRQKSRWGTARDIDAQSVIQMDKRFPSTFNNYDYLNKKVTIAPGSPCPILFGIRGERTNVLEKAMRTVKSERIDRWLLFETNQGTDEHLVKPTKSARPHTSVILRGRVTSAPRVHLGGHVIFRIDGSGSIDCAAYEPSKQFRRVARALIPGDKIVVHGSVRDKPRTINVEKFQIIRLATARKKIANPVCKPCRKRMKSIGHDAGFRCIRCGAKVASSAATWTEVKRPLKVGWYEPPVSARRHISKPLKRMRVKANPYPPP